MLETYIEKCIINGNIVKIITVNGYQMICKILHEEHDYVIVLNANKEKLIFKHAISTIEPADKNNS